MENPDFECLAVQTASPILQGLIHFLLGVYKMQEGHLLYEVKIRKRPILHSDDLGTFANYHFLLLLFLYLNFF